MVKIVLLIALLFVSTEVAMLSSAEQKKPFIQNEVTKRDSRGRVEIMETHTTSGTCMAQITYEEVPRIHLIVITPTKLENIGYAQINGGTKDTLSDAVLTGVFNDTINEFCLPLIIPGYVII